MQQKLNYSVTNRYNITFCFAMFCFTNSYELNKSDHQHLAYQCISSQLLTGAGQQKQNKKHSVNVLNYLTSSITLCGFGVCGIDLVSPTGST